MKRYFSTLIIILISALSFTLSAEEKNSYPYTNAGYDLISEGKYDEAAALLKKGVAAGEKQCYGALSYLYLTFIPNEIEFKKWNEKGREAGNSTSYEMYITKLFLDYGEDAMNNLEHLEEVAYASQQGLLCDDSGILSNDTYGNFCLYVATYFMATGDEEHGLNIIDAGLDAVPNHTSLLGLKSIYYYMNEEYSKAYAAAVKADNDDVVQGTYILGLCLLYGDGCAENEALGIKKLRKAAHAMPEASYWLGVCYEEGIGTPVDKAEAKRWFKYAADRGNADAIEALKKY